MDGQVCLRHCGSRIFEVVGLHRDTLLQKFPRVDKFKNAFLDHLGPEFRRIQVAQ